MNHPKITLVGFSHFAMHKFFDVKSQWRNPISLVQHIKRPVVLHFQCAKKDYLLLKLLCCARLAHGVRTEIVVELKAISKITVASISRG